MSDHMKRRETVHIDEIARTSAGTLQWFLEARAGQEGAVPPITHNNDVHVFICGEDGFADIAAHINTARKSIDLCCWGFDPGMELIRSNGTATWPRGATFGDMLAEAGGRGVKVRLLVWLDADAIAGTLATANPCNLPGWTHGTYFFDNEISQAGADAVNADASVARRRADSKQRVGDGKGKVAALDDVALATLARQEYCRDWFNAARGLKGRLANVSVAHRAGRRHAIEASLASEEHPPSGLAQGSAERQGMVTLGTHHQKTILIDYEDNGGANAVGYVMGLNSITDYWDTAAHEIEDVRRESFDKRKREELPGAHAAEAAGKKKGGKNTVQSAQFCTRKPYRDYACRIKQGGALIDVHKNFASAWLRATLAGHPHARAHMEKELAAESVPEQLRHKRKGSDSSVQIVRTQPEEMDKSVKDAYFQATDISTLAGGYLYLENQYFQYRAWSERLLRKRAMVINAWNSATIGKKGRGLESMPVQHVFLVIPAPELAAMIPRTYDALAVLGQQDCMLGQTSLIDSANQNSTRDPPAVVKQANAIDKPDEVTLKNSFGLRVATATLQTSGIVDGEWCYREVYIHSKLMLVDDCFTLLGSANMNQRSMAVDSELNMSTDDPRIAEDLRRRIWSQLSGGQVSGGSGNRKDIQDAFDKWCRLMRGNKKAKKKVQALTGFILPLEDTRSSTTILG